VAIKNVGDEHDLMIINKSGIAIRLSVAECRIMGRATQGVRLINLTKKNDVIASVCKVMGAELEANVEQMSRAEWAQKSDSIKRDNEPDVTVEHHAANDDDLDEDFPDEEIVDDIDNELVDNDVDNDEINDDEIQDDGDLTDNNDDNDAQ